MAEAVLDSSALIALIFRESGHDRVEARLAGAAMSAVNLAEVADFLARKGMARDAAEKALGALKLEIAVADEAAAFAVSELYLATRPAGLSLADRFCLALARRLKRPAVTADRAWSRVADAIGVRIEPIR